MDNVLFDFKTGIEKLTQAELELYEGRLDEGTSYIFQNGAYSKSNRIIHKAMF
jgi:hypothetical protein